MADRDQLELTDHLFLGYTRSDPRPSLIRYDS